MGLGFVRSPWARVVFWGVGLLSGGLAFAATSGGLGEVASNVTGDLKNFAKLVTAVSYLCGLAFAISSLLGFKAHKDSPSNNPISKPIVLMFVAVGLLFLPLVFKRAGATLFGDSTSGGGSISGFVSLTGT